MMEVTLFLIIIFLLFYIISFQKKEIGKLREGLSITFDELKQIKRILENNTFKSSEDAPPSKQIVKDIIEEKKVEITPPPIIQEKPIRREEFIEKIAAKIKQESATPPSTPIPKKETQQQHIPKEPELSWFAKFKENNPDLEKFIGENLINKIGIIILVLGISFFVRYAIAKEWINEPARVGIGILSGGIILGFAHRLRRKFKAFSSVLVAGAIAVFYFTIGIAFHEYHIFSQNTAFIIMVLITVFSVFVSIAYNRQELGVLSTVAGFAVPFMVSTGEGNYHVLLSYLAILNVGILIISYYKRWFIVNFTALIATVLVVAGWYLTLTDPNALVIHNALLYCSLFYFIFSIAFVINNVIHNNKFAYYEIAALMSTTALYFAIGTHIINELNSTYLGLFSISLGFINIVFAYVVYKRYKFDKNIVYVLIGLALTLATVTLPIQFEGNYITIFWACEAVLLFWLSQKSQLKGFTLAGIIVQSLALVSLVMDLNNYVNDTVPYIIGFNLQFLTALMVIGSLIFTYKIFHKHDFSLSYFNVAFNPVSYRIFAFDLAVILAYILPLTEIYYQSSAYFDNIYSTLFFLYLYHMLFTTVAVYIIQDKKNQLKPFPNIIIVINMVLYILMAYRLPISEKEHTFYGSEGFPYAFNLHYITLILLGHQVWQYVRYRIFHANPQVTIKSMSIWFVTFFITYLLSVEINTVFLFQTANFTEFYDQKLFVIKVIFPILWGSIAFGLLLLGIKKQIKPIRILALVLLSITILKLFIYDIQDVSETGKIVAFILLGVLILIISFVYQKIKKLVVDNEKTNS
ncbi:MAG TPA: DUF2339 domain-containing protein [Sphingobacterium bovisgrunnientis]|jgi:uncharacterized membrane protein|nr:DUF2339 domain-containing protein [Sphingobacterium bovisgrunnientis]